MKPIFLSLLLATGSTFAAGPVPRPDPARFASEIDAFAKQNPGRGGIVFTGSSSIRLWANLKEDFPDLPVTNRGFGGCVTNDLTASARNGPR